MAKRTAEDIWSGFLTGDLRGLDLMRRIFKRVPSSPRCKLCLAPFAGVGKVVLRPITGGISPLNPRICTMCIRQIGQQPGGAEVEISVLFADVRGSTGLAERMSPEAFSKLMARFYGTAARVVDAEDGIVDKFVGDAAVALFIPGFVGARHAAAAVSAARELVRRAAEGDGDAIPLGAGVHTGVSYVGVVGEGDASDFTALGDTVNTAARLADAAGAGEVLVSDAAAASAELDTTGLERRTLELRGREQTVDVWVAPPT